MREKHGRAQLTKTPRSTDKIIPRGRYPQAREVGGPARPRGEAHVQASHNLVLMVAALAVHPAFWGGPPQSDHLRRQQTAATEGGGPLGRACGVAAARFRSSDARSPIFRAVRAFCATGESTAARLRVRFTWSFVCVRPSDVRTDHRTDHSKRAMCADLCRGHCPTCNVPNGTRSTAAGSCGGHGAAAGCSRGDGKGGPEARAASPPAVGPGRAPVPSSEHEYVDQKYVSDTESTYLCHGAGTTPTSWVMRAG
eukprot:COSAG01_NODE_2019_length_8634_cov_14.764499_6_plen_253_part_00